MMEKKRTYIAIDLKSFYASVECKERNRDPLTTNLVVADKSRTEKTICIPIYLFYVLLCVYAINGTQTFWGGFWQCFVILSVMNLIDRLGIDGYWVGHTKAWVIPGTEDLMPYISKSDKQKKWLFGTLGMAVISLLLAGLGLLL